MSQGIQPLTLVVMAGAPGSGKTTLALALSRALGWPVVDKDTLKSPLLEVGVPEKLAGHASYELLFEVGRDLLLRQGFSVILDSPAGYPIVIRKAEALAREAGAILKFVLCLADYAVREERLAMREKRRSQWTTAAANLDHGDEQWSRLLPADSLFVRTDQEASDLMPSVIRYLCDVAGRNSPHTR
ncbi:MAG: AAA family ATPase [Thermomicrobiales bacterium]